MFSTIVWYLRSLALRAASASRCAVISRLISTRPCTTPRASRTGIWLS